VYAVAAIAYGAVMTAAWLVATRDPEISPVKVLTIFWMYLWPLTIATVLVAVSDRTTATKVFGAYFIGLAILAVLALARSPRLRAIDLPLFWLLEAGPPSLLAFAFLARPIRAVGPMVAAFLVVAVTGSQVVVSVADANPGVLRRISSLGLVLGLGATAVFAGMMRVSRVHRRWSGAAIRRERGRSRSPD